MGDTQVPDALRTRLQDGLFKTADRMRNQSR